MALKIAKKTGTATVSKQMKDKGSVIAEETAAEEVPALAGSAGAQGAAGPWCEVGVDASYTHNLGNYQSARVGVTLKIPCLAPEIDKIFDYAKTWVDAKMQALIEDLQDS